MNGYELTVSLLIYAMLQCNVNCTKVQNCTNNSTWIFDPQYPGICYSSSSATPTAQTFEAATTACNTTYTNSTLPIFRNIAEFNAFQRMKQKFQDDLFTCATTNMAHLGLTYNMGNLTWMNGQLLQDEFQPYFRNLTFSPNTTSIAFPTNLDIFRGISSSDQINYRCQIILSSQAVDISSLKEPTGCPYGWHVDSSELICYQYNSSFLTFDQANKACQSINATLPYFVTESEYDQFHNLQNAINVGCIEDATQNWIGIRNYMQPTSSLSIIESMPFCAFVDMTNNTVPFNTSWYMQPDNSMNTCVIKNYNNVSRNSWYPINCTERHSFFCQFRLNQSASTTAMQTLPTTATPLAKTCNETNPAWRFDPQFPGICYTNWTDKSSNYTTAQLSCKANFLTASLPIFHSIDEFNAMLRISYKQIAAKEAGWTTSSSFYGQLGLSYNNGSTPIWDDGIPLESFFQIYNKTSQFTIKEKSVCISLNGDTWLGINTTATCNVRCQIRLSSDAVDISNLKEPNGCPYGWFIDASEKNCYIYNSSYQTYDAAKSSCESIGANLPYFVFDSEYKEFHQIQTDTNIGTNIDAIPQWIGSKSDPSISGPNCSFVDATGRSNTFDIHKSPGTCDQNMVKCAVKNSGLVISDSLVGLNCTELHSFFCQKRLYTTTLNQNNVIVSMSNCSNYTTSSTSTSLGQTTKTPTIQAVATTSTIPSTIINYIPCNSSTSPNPTTTPVCEQSEWGPFSQCSSTCGSSATKTRSRMIQNLHTPSKCTTVRQTVSCDGSLPLCNPMSETEQLIATFANALGNLYIVGATLMSFVFSLMLCSFDYERLLHMAQEFTLCVAHILVALMGSRVEFQLPCRLASLGMLLFFSSNFMFLLLETLQTYFIFTNVISSGQILSTKFSAALGFCIPTLLVIVTWLSGYDELASEFSCFINWKSSVSLISLFSILIISVISIVTLEAVGMGPFHDMPLSCEYQMHAALVSKHGLLFILPLSIASWFLTAIGLYEQQFAWFPTIFGINIALGCFVTFFHLLGNTKVKTLLKKLKRSLHC